MQRQRLWPWLLGTAGALSFSAILWRYLTPLLRGPPPRTIVVQQIFVYPLKGAKGISVQKAAIGKFGLKYAQDFMLSTLSQSSDVTSRPLSHHHRFRYDRLWMIVDAETKSFITQRQDPRLVLIETRLSSSHLLLHAPGMVPLAIPYESKVR